MSPSATGFLEVLGATHLLVDLAGGAERVVFAPHDMEDLMALSRSLGERLVGTVATLAFERELTRPLALIAGASFGRPRPRIVVVTGFDPLELAGGHSFETDLIEIAGGTSVRSLLLRTWSVEQDPQVLPTR